MTITIPLKQIAELAVSDSLRKNLSGQIKTYDELLCPETIDAIDIAHNGVYGILAYDDALDTHIAEYISSGGLEKDSSDQLLILYASGKETTSKSQKRHQFNEIPGVELESRANASYEFVRAAFRNGAAPRLPGVMFLARLGAKIEPVFLSAANTTKQSEVRAVLADGFRHASEVASVAPELFSSKLSESLAGSPLSTRYQRAASMSASEALIRFWKLVLSQRKDIISVIKMFS